MPKKYIYLWSTAPTLPGYWGGMMALKERRDIVPSLDMFYYYDGTSNVITAYAAQESIAYAKRVVSKKYTKPTFFKKYQAQYRQERVRWWQWAHAIEKKDYSHVSRSQLAKDHQQFLDYLRDSVSYFWTTRPEPTYATEQELEKILKKYFKDQWMTAFAISVRALVLDEVQREYLARLQLRSRATKKELATHASHFPWFVFGQLSENKALAFVRRARNHEKETHKAAQQRLQNEKKTIQKKQKELYKKAGKDAARVRYLASVLQTQAVERKKFALSAAKKQKGCSSRI